MAKVQGVTGSAEAGTRHASRGAGTHDPGSRFVAETLLAQLWAFNAEAPGVRRAQDPECIHRMRVASRRLRTMLDLFAAWLPARPLPGWVRRVRRITRALGEARDHDVQLLHLEEYIAGVTEARDKPGLARLDLRLRQSREKLQHAVLKALDDLEESHLLTEMEDYLRRVHARTQGQSAEAGSAGLFCRAEDVICEQLNELLSYEMYLEAPDAADRFRMLHMMRIAAKHLRYSMMTFAPLYGEDFQEALKAVRGTQERLGDFHDADVWATFLPTFLEEERARMTAYMGSARGFGRLRPGIQHLLEERIAQRTAVLGDFRTYWGKVRARGVWEGLRVALAARLPAAEAEAGGDTDAPAGADAGESEATQEGGDL